MFISFSASHLVCRHYKQATTSDENGEMMEIHHCTGGISVVASSPEKLMEIMLAAGLFCR
ncbi:hypothetical protein [Klebsiella quasipneumoniae]|uniref:hypothetical protein n=1 Tax=Klebsiella quasipneumoniae TaxID=1463165 RepID=UPI001C527F48|nr:hypothetical protein [Klebsiella quasipneumoniae]